MFRSPQQRAKRFLRIAQWYVGADCYGAAIQAMDQAITYTPTAELYDYRGIVLAIASRNEEAVASFGKALELAATNQERASISFHRGVLYAREHGYDQAVLDLRRACRLNPGDPTYREALAQLQRECARSSDDTDPVVSPNPLT